VGGVDGEGGGQMDRVKAAQAVVLGELTGMPCQGPVDADQQHRLAGRLQLADRAAVRSLVDASAAVSRGQCGARLGVGEAAGEPRR